MEQKAVKSNNMKAFAIFYFINGHKTVIYKLKSTNGKQALQTFIRHRWNGLKYKFEKLNVSAELTFYGQIFRPEWIATREGFISLASEELR